ncbi:Flagellar hook-length control protein FliK [Minicystis rosea]|nr:Flagellar hook-length control protein FliK [Minicystis rosea]
MGPDGTGKPGKPGKEPGGQGSSTSKPAKPVTSCTVKSDKIIGDGETPAIAFGGGHFAVAYTDPRDNGGDVVLVIADDHGSVLGEHRVSSGPGAAVSPAVTTLAGGGFLLTWEELAGAGGDVRALHVDADGKPRGKVITVASAGSHEAHPDATETANGALVAWTEAGGARIGEIKDGALSGQIALPGSAQAAVASARSGGAAVWSVGAQIGFAKLPSALGGEVPSPITFRTAAGRGNVPRVAAGPDGSYLVVWEDTRGGADNEAIYFATIGEGGKPSDEKQISPPSGSANYPDVAFIGGRAAVTYYQWRDGPSSVYLSLIDPSRGPVGEELKISGKAAARFPRIVSAKGTELGVSYAQRDGSIRLAIVTCE